MVSVKKTHWGYILYSTFHAEDLNEVFICCTGDRIMAENESAPLLSAAADAAPPQYSDVTTQNPCEYKYIGVGPLV